jgi:NgoPII restriction endonuclease
MNSMGEGFELYIKNLFCGYLDDIKQDKINYEDYFSYLGNNTNPPDLIIKNSDAIEIKKIEGVNSDLAFNSSSPKNKLSSKSTLITESCRNCEENPWSEKDIVYIIGSVKSNKLKKMWIVYGDCYCANIETYENARTKKVDPLEITQLGMSGKCRIKNPNKAFCYLDNINKFELNCLILKEKYLSFPKLDRDEIENNRKIKICDAKIKDPNNPAKLLEAKLIQTNL